MQKGHWAILGAVALSTLITVGTVTALIKPQVKTVEVVKKVLVTPTPVVSATPAVSKLRVQTPAASTGAVKK